MAKNFLVDIDSITLNTTSKNLPYYEARCLLCHKKLKLYDEYCDQLFKSDGPNSAYIEIISTKFWKIVRWG